MRKIIQISSVPCGENDTSYNSAYLFALCDDGSIWKLERSKISPDWTKLPEIPKDEESQTQVMNDTLASYDKTLEQKVFSPYCIECGQNLQLGFHNTNCPANGHGQLFRRV